MNQQREPVARRQRHKKGKSHSFVFFLLTIVLCAVTAIAIADHPTAATAGNRDEGLHIAELNGQKHETITRQPENDILPEARLEDAVIPDRQPEGSSPSVSRDAGGDWMLTLVNAGNPLPEGYAPQLKSLANGLQFDERAIDQLNAMLSAAKQQGLSPVVCSAYRTTEKQRSLFDSKVSKLIASGLGPDQADSEARKHVAYPGTSEHNFGLAADIVSLSYQHLDDKQADTPEVRWLREHCAEYGFILRYPSGKEELTGVAYEPWHFRYVGEQTAREITGSGLCLEEYLAGL